MKITDIRIRRIESEGPMKGFVSVVFDDSFAVHDIKIIAARDKTFVVMPSVKNSFGISKDLAHPVTREFRAYVEKVILNAYYACVEEEAQSDDETQAEETAESEENAE